MVRRNLAGLIAVVILLSWPWSPIARADIDQPRIFIETLGSEVIEMLSDPVLSKEDRIAEFRRLLVNGFDLRTIGRFILGRYWRRATPEQRREFELLFEDYIVATYAARLGRCRSLHLRRASSDPLGNLLRLDRLVEHEVIYFCTISSAHCAITA